ILQRRNLIGPNGELTIVIHSINNFTSEQARQNSRSGAFQYSSAVVGGLESLSYTVHNGAGIVENNDPDKWDPDIRQKDIVEDPNQGEPDSIHRLEWNGKILIPLHVTKNKD